MALVTEADLVVRAGGADEFLKLFDRDGDGTADTELVAAAIRWSTSVVYSKLGASYPGVRFDDPGPVPDEIVDITARLAVGYAEEGSPAFRNLKREKGTGFKAVAMADLDALATGTNAQLPSGPADPYANGSAYVHAPTPVFGAVAVTPSSDPDNGGYSGF